MTLPSTSNEGQRRRAGGDPSKEVLAMLFWAPSLRTPGRGEHKTYTGIKYQEMMYTILLLRNTCTIFLGFISFGTGS